MRASLAACLFAAALAGGASAVSAAPPAKDPLASLTYGTWGFDLGGRDTAVKPGDDFAGYASGAWLKSAAIPADHSRWGAFDILRDLSDARVHAILEAAAAKAPAVPVTEEDKIGAFYKAFMDRVTVERAGIVPLQPMLTAIAKAPSRAALAELTGAASGGFGDGLFRLSVSPDVKDPKAYVLTVSQGGLGMPDREYYLDPRFDQKKFVYQGYVTEMLVKLRWPDAPLRAVDVVSFETMLAEASWPRADRRDPDKTYHPVETKDLERTAPGFEWGAFLRGAGVGGVSRVNLRENTAAKRLAEIWGRVPLETLKAWAAFHLADSAADVLPESFAEARFEFRGQALAGTPQIRPMWKRAGDLIGSLDAGMGDAVGKLYVDRWFPASSKAKMETLVENLRAAFKARIEANDWMSPATRTSALEKLANYKVMVGYPDKWRDYSQLQIFPNDLFGDALRARAASWAFERGLLGRPVDRSLWQMTPQTVNAYNAGPLVEVVFPAAILQPPFFDPNAELAVNYGAIGSVIGHEMTHGFDDAGRKIDASGRLRDWWGPEDAARFEARASKFGAEFAAYDTGLGVSINPKLTMGENIADLGGMNVALDAYHHALTGRPAPVIDGYTGDQRFFLAYAQIWRELARPDGQRLLLTTDPHAPGRYRAITSERNVDAWYKAFDVQPGQKLYIAPQDRVTIW